MVDADQADACTSQFHNLRIREIYAGHKDAIQVAVAAVLKIADGALANGAVEQHQVIALLLHGILEMLQHADKKVMKQAVVVIILQQDADDETAVGLERLGSGVGQIAQAGSAFANAQRGLGAHARHMVERFGN